MRIDKYLSLAGLGTRSSVRGIVKSKKVQINGKVVTDGKTQVSESDSVTFQDEVLSVQEDYYWMLNKPADVITATSDEKQSTVLDLLAPADFRKDLFPVGRLDKDTTGLLILTNDGPLGHQLTSPKRHITKKYEATLAGIVDDEDVEQFKQGVSLKDGYLTKPAELTIIHTDDTNNRSTVEIVIHEGKYHQVKRMCAARHKPVEALKRVAMGSVILDAQLKPGEYRALTATEIKNLQNG